jgi:hypothetical protein
MLASIASEKGFAMKDEIVSVISSEHSKDDSFGSSDGDHMSQPSADRDEVKEVQRLAHKETSHVRMGKLLVLVSILATAALVSTGTYIVLKDQEDDDYTDSVSIENCTASIRRMSTESLVFFAFISP